LDTWKPSDKMVVDWSRIWPIAAGGTALVAFIVCLVMFWPESKKEDPDPVNELVEEKSDQFSMATIRKELLNPSEAKEGFKKLQTKVDEGDAEALFILSRLYAVSSGSFTLHDDFVTMQANLEGTVSPNPAKAHKLLLETIEKKPNSYQALYELEPRILYSLTRYLLYSESTNLTRNYGRKDKQNIASGRSCTNNFKRRVMPCLWSIRHRWP